MHSYHVVLIGVAVAAIVVTVQLRPPAQPAAMIFNQGHTPPAPANERAALLSILSSKTASEENAFHAIQIPMTPAQAWIDWAASQVAGPDLLSRPSLIGDGGGASSSAPGLEIVATTPQTTASAGNDHDTRDKVRNFHHLSSF